MILSAALIGVAQLLLLGFCGLGLARLLLPARLRAHELTLAPIFGLALLALLGYYGANAGLTMRQILPIALLAAGALLAASIWRPADRQLRTLPARELAPLLLLLAAGWLIDIAPAANYGALLPIGSNWDIEFYLPLSEYLKDFSYPTLAQAPANPLLNVVLSNPTFTRAMGASYAQALADLIGGWDSWASWVPMLASLHTLALSGLYALLRAGLGVRPAGALAGVALAAINGLLLWTTYNSFGMGLGGLALLPAALEARSARATLAAGLLLGGLTCTYWPMLMAYAVGAAGMGLALLWERRRAGAPALIGRGALVIAIGGALGLLANLRAPAAFLQAFAAEVPSMGITTFISPATILGAAPMPWRSQTIGAPAEVALGWAGLACALALGGLGVWYGSRRRGLAAGLGLAGLAYLAALQFGAQFPYGFLRGASYVNMLLLGLVGAGLPPWATAARPRAARAATLAAAGLALLLLLSSAVASGRTYQIYARRPALFGAEVARLRADMGRLRLPGSVFISPPAATALCDTAFTPWAYALRRHELIGEVSTGYTLLRNPRPGVAPDYRLLARGEDLGEYGLANSSPIWSGDLVAVYELPASQVGWLSGRDSASEPPLCGRTAMALSRAQQGRGSYRAAQAGRPLALYAGASAIGWGPVGGGPARRDLTLALASFAPQTIEISLGDQRRRVELPAGLSIYRAESLEVPAAITIGASAGPVALRWAALADAGAPSPPELGARTLLLGLRGEARPGGARVRLQAQSAGPELLRYSVEIYENRPGFRDAPARYASAPLPALPSGAYQIDLDLREPRIALDGRALPVSAPAAHDGEYFAALYVYQGEQLRARLPFLSFERRGGQISAVSPLDLDPAFVPLAEPRQPVAADFEGAVSLRRFELDATAARPGDQIRASLLWRAERPQGPARLVFVQLLDNANHKIAQWDGAVGGDSWPPQGWLPGQEIWQDIPLKIAADAAPGRYRLIAGVADPATGMRLRLPGGADALQLGQVDILPPADPAR